MRFRSFLLLLALYGGQPAWGQFEVLAHYSFDKDGSVDEWEPMGPGFVPPELWGEVRWTGNDGHPSPGAMELTAGAGIEPSIAALGPCLPPAQQFEGRVISLQGFRKNLSHPDTCTLSLWTYSSVDDCGGLADGSITAGEFSNLGSINRWDLYTVCCFLLDEPGIRSLRPVAFATANAGDRCLVDSMTVKIFDYSEIPLRPATSVGLALLLALAALWQMNRG